MWPDPAKAPFNRVESLTCCVTEDRRWNRESFVVTEDLRRTRCWITTRYFDYWLEAYFSLLVLHTTATVLTAGFKPAEVVIQPRGCCHGYLGSRERRATGSLAWSNIGDVLLLLITFILVNICFCAERAIRYTWIDWKHFKSWLSLVTGEMFSSLDAIFQRKLCFQYCRISGWRKHQWTESFFVRFWVFKPVSHKTYPMELILMSPFVTVTNWGRQERERQDVGGGVVTMICRQDMHATCHSNYMFNL